MARADDSFVSSSPRRIQSSALELVSLSPDRQRWLVAHPEADPELKPGVLDRAREIPRGR
jgi:hypothetical protein